MPFLTAGDGSLINIAHVAKIEVNERAGDDSGGRVGEWVALNSSGGVLGRRSDYPSLLEANYYLAKVIGS